MRFAGRALGCSVALAVSVLCAPHPARADQLADVRAAMAASGAAVKSLRIVMSSPFGFTNTMTMLVQPRRAHMLMTAGTVAIEVFIVDNVAYFKSGSAGWKKQTLPAQAALLDYMKTFVNASHMTLGPDETDAGVVYGTLQIDVTVPQLPGVPLASTMPNLTLTCSYDKSTYRMHQCKNDLVTETFEGYNDPENVIELPAALADAVDAGPLVMPGMLAPPSPSPSATP